MIYTYITLFLLYTFIPPTILYFCLKSIYQQKYLYGWHLHYLAKYFISLSFLPLLYFPQIDLALKPQSELSILFLIITLTLALLGIKYDIKKTVLYFYLGGVFAAFMEEILFRGVLFGLAHEIWNNSTISIIVTSLAFGIWHLKNYAWHKDKRVVTMQFLYTGLIYGPLFAILRILTGDIYLAVLWHFITDSYVALAPKRFRWTIIGDRDKGVGFKDKLNH